MCTGNHISDKLMQSLKKSLENNAKQSAIRKQALTNKIAAKKEKQQKPNVVPEGKERKQIAPVKKEVTGKACAPETSTGMCMY